MYLHLLLGWIIKQVNQENMGSVGEQRMNGFFIVTAVHLIKDSSETLQYMEYGQVNPSWLHRNMQQRLCQNLDPTI